MVLDFMTNLDYNMQADNLKCKQPEQNVEKSRSLVERARLEIVYTPQGYRGFESLLLRHKNNHTFRCGYFYGCREKFTMLQQSEFALRQGLFDKVQ